MTSGMVGQLLHICKMAVGVRDIAHLRKIQESRFRADSALFHRTRNAPRRAEEVLDGGSLYWVISGAMTVRQRILGIEPDQREDGGACTALHLHPELVPVAARAMKPFQGWRYLQAADAPADLGARMQALGEDALPDELRQALQVLCLL